MDEAWSVRRGWAELRRDGELTLSADATARSRIARFVDVEALEGLSVTLTHGAWLDGVELDGRVEATATRICGVSLDPFDERVDTTFRVRLVPEGSANAPAQEAELVVDLDVDDPPEVASGSDIDLATYVVEAVALALDPFPRKPGVVFDYADPKGKVSPFASLRSAVSDD